MGSGTAEAFPHSPPDSAENCGKRHGKRHAFSGSTAAAGLAGDSCDGGRGHDTQCAAFAAPAKTDKHVFLSCGTWSLFGTEPEQPVLTEQAAALGLSNEIGYGKRVTFLKNIIGLWLLQESRREYARQGKNYSFAEIETMARAEPRTVQLYRSGRSGLCAPRDIPRRVQAFCLENRSACAGERRSHFPLHL